MEFNRTNYEKMLDELFARHPSVQKDGFTAGAYKPGLGGMMEFDARLGHPWRNFKTIHVAGTNGKGSVCSMLAAALAANGYKVGLYTSPHLIDFRERAKIIEGGGWRMISEEEVWDFVNGHELEDLSFFEITTGLAFSWFASQQVDIAVIETGLGGRLDSTNIITPELCIITSIGLDHCKMLGSTRAEIAAEKAGIFKPGVPAVVSEEDWETAGVFERKAAHFATVDGEYEENLRKKLALLDEMAAADVRTGGYEVIRDFQRRWSEIGFVPIKQKDAIQKRYKAAVDELFNVLRGSERDRSMGRFREKLSSMKGAGDRRLRSERERLYNKVRQLEQEIALLENNIGFFAKSKNAESLIADVRAKIERAREEMNATVEKVRMIDSQEAEENQPDNK